MGTVLILAISSRSALACLWDQDTLKQEAKGIPDVVDVVTGWFDREPTLYYQMRLDRMTAALAKDPTDLNAYDDAGVACDRMGRDDEAIAWMDRKLEQLQKRPDDGVTKEHRYRYLANVGTFWVHHWVRSGADRAKIEEVKKARDYVAEAIKLNPEAHFGREKYQLMALEWIIDPKASLGPQLALTQPSDFGGDFPNFLSMPHHYTGGTFFPTKSGSFGAAWESEKDPKKKEQMTSHALKGLSGLVVLGNAWESVDTFVAMGVLVRSQGRMSVVQLVRDRIEELTKAGKISFYPGSPVGDTLVKCMEEPFRGPTQVAESYAPQIDEFYKKARAAADDRNAKREAFMLERLKAGRHPDTDPTFWNGYVEPAKVEFPEPSFPLTAERDRIAAENSIHRLPKAVFCVLMISIVARQLWKIRRQAKKTKGEA